MNPAYIALSHKRIGLAENPLTYRSDEAKDASLFHQEPA